MAYTTYTAVKDSLEFEYWLTASRKIAEDGYAYTEDPNVFTDEEDFINNFINRTSDLIDGIIGTGYSTTSGLLESCNRWLAIYEIEQYVRSATNDRVLSVTINEDKKRALNWLLKIASGELYVPPASSTTTSSLSPQLIEGDNDGVTLTLGALEEDILLTGAADAETIPE